MTRCGCCGVECDHGQNVEIDHTDKECIEALGFEVRSLESLVEELSDRLNDALEKRLL